MLERTARKPTPLRALSQLTRAQMADVIVAALQDALPDFSVHRPRGDTGIVRLYHHRTGAEADPVHIAPLLETLLERSQADTEMAARIADFVAEVCGAIGLTVLDPQAVYPALRHHEVLDVYGDDAFTRAGPGDCGIVLMLRSGTQVSTVEPAEARRAGFEPDMLWEAAERNLTAAMAQRVIHEPEPGLHRMEIPGMPWLGNTLLIAPQVLRKGLAELGFESCYLAAPTRASVDIVDASDPRGLARLTAWLRARLMEPNPQSEMVFAFGSQTLIPTPRFFFSDGSLRPLS